jgi:serine/threonine-protein kinase
VLAFVHQNNVIHRDIKPSNIMRRRCDGKLILIDFGLVKLVNASGAVSSTIPIGTHGYVPIEQARGQPRFSSDIYAVGMTAIQALTGIDNPSKLPEDNNGEVVWRDRTQVSDWLADILIKMVRYDFRQRYQSATEALQALNPTVVSLPALQLPPPVTPLEPFISNNKWGYKDKDGKVVIQPQYNSAANFSEGLARVRLGYKYGYIDQMGTVVIEPLFGWAGSFSEELARVMNNSKFSYINQEGKFVNQQPFDGALDFSEGLAAVMIDKKWGYINKRGELVIQPRFDGAENFSQERARVRIDWQWRYIDKAGKFIDS